MYKNISDVTLESLKKDCTMIHYFGLGFIQVKLGEEFRVHFYTDLLPAIIDEEDVHNHRYDFISKILAGEFRQQIFEVVPGDSHLMEKESCKQGMDAKEPPQPCGIRKIMDQTFAAGSSYSISHELFHKVASEHAVTLLQRKPIAKEFADVIRPIGAPKVCPFSKKVEEEELWKIVGSILPAYQHPRSPHIFQR